MAYGGANLVPIAVSLSCVKCLKLCSKTLFYKTHPGKRNKLSVEMVWSSRLLSAFRIASSPSLCGIFGYNPTASKSTENKIIWQISKFIKFFQEIVCVLYKRLNFLR